MKSPALCLLAIAAPACNWVFGIEETLLADAAAPIDAPRPTGRLTWMIALTDAQGGPVSSTTLAPIIPSPSVQVGLPAGPLIDVTLDASGRFEAPAELADMAWRVVYQMPGDLPREVHWTPVPERVPHAIVPLFGRLDRAAIPGPNTTMSLTPSNMMPSTHRGPRVFTTGVWTESQPVFPVPAGSTFNYNLNQSTQLSGPSGAPERAKGDFVVLTDFGTTASCRTSEGSAAFSLDLADGPSTTISAEDWANSGVPVMASGDSIDNRVRATNTAYSADPLIIRSVIQVGPAPSTSMPAFTVRTPQLGLRSPLILAMLQCTDTNLAALPDFNLPDSLSAFPRLAHFELSADRTVSGGGPTLTSGLAAVTPVTNGIAALDMSVAVPIAPFQLGTTDLATADHVMLPAGTEPLTLTFGVEAMLRADYFEVVLHRITGTSTVAERIYTITQPSLTLERSVLNAGELVFEIRAFRGAPDASVADFTRYESAQSSATVWTRTFVVP